MNYYFNCLLPKEWGISSDILKPLVKPSMYTIISGLNSAKTCLHAPHGNAGVLPEEVIAIESISLQPSETALKTAVLSAQLLKPYETFSTLHPLKIFPLDVIKAAPTLNFEYGQ